MVVKYQTKLFPFHFYIIRQESMLRVNHDHVHEHDYTLSNPEHAPHHTKCEHWLESL